jgi:EAL domain-containing protein (putative c-di-GMP-specific phosphodiesterase class I)/GGDEF domain-containing protein
MDLTAPELLSLNSVVRPGSVAEVIREQSLRVLFQPIAALRGGEIFAHEALIRGPAGSLIEFPDALFAAAANGALRTQLELACIEAALRRLHEQPIEGHLFLNLSGKVLYTVARDWGTERLLRWFEKQNVPLSKLVIEITEHDRISDVDGLKLIIDLLRARGIGFALDDFGDGHSSLRMWAEIQPSFVKIDKFFTADLATSSYKVRTLKALGLMSEILGGTLIAEGIEDEFQLAVVRDLGIGLGQGYFLGRPEPEAITQLTGAAADAIASREIAVIAQSSAAAPKGISAERLLIQAPSVAPDVPNDQVLKLFQAKPELHAVAVVEDRRPVGLITRRTFMDNFTHGFHKELFARRPCAMFMDTQPRILEVTADLATMIAMLTSADQRYLTDGFIVADAGVYLGLGTGEQLVRTVTEQRIEAARHANPLTFLPGNIPISEHIEKLLNSGNTFSAAYCDLNHFKPFNDQYGYWRGDEMIRLLAGVLIATVDSRLDFVGHVGGDDFVVLFQSLDWEVRCKQIIATFNERARGLFDEEALQRGGIESEDREGNPTFFPLTTLAIGAVEIMPGRYQYAEDVASAAATAKRKAKRLKLGFSR